MKIDLEKLEALAKAATPVPWKDKSFKRNYDWGVICSGGKRIAQCTSADVTDERKRVTFEEKLANAAYIAAACNAVPELIAKVRELEREREWLVNELCVGTQCDFPSQIECKYRTERGYYCPEQKEKFRCWVAHAEQAAKEAGE